MNKLIPFSTIGVLFSVLFLSSCKEEKKSNIIITHKPAVQKPKPTQKMSAYEQARDVEWVGSTYKVIVSRKADSSLPLVTQDENTKYYDNKVSVRVVRQDGSEFFNRTFTKSDFSGYVSDKMKEKSALLGVVFFKAEGDYMYFAASVGAPDVTSDEYVPMVVKLSRMGAVSVNKDESLDEMNPSTDNAKAPTHEVEASDEDGV